MLDGEGQPRRCGCCSSTSAARWGGEPGLHAGASPRCWREPPDHGCSPCSHRLHRAARQAKPAPSAHQARRPIGSKRGRSAIAPLRDSTDAFAVHAYYSVISAWAGYGVNGIRPPRLDHADRRHPARPDHAVHRARALRAGALVWLDPSPLHRRFLQLIVTELADLAGGSNA